MLEHHEDHCMLSILSVDYHRLIPHALYRYSENKGRTGQQGVQLWLPSPKTQAFDCAPPPYRRSLKILACEKRTRILITLRIPSVLCIVNAIRTKPGIERPQKLSSAPRVSSRDDLCSFQRIVHRIASAYTTDDHLLERGARFFKTSTSLCSEAF
mgnify:CR=1 FL=1